MLLLKVGTVLREYHYFFANKVDTVTLRPMTRLHRKSSTGDLALLCHRILTTNTKRIKEL